MDERDRIAELHDQALDVRVRVLESHRRVVEELTAIWNELNELAAGRPEVRRIADEVSSDITRIEKLDLELDTEWLADAKRRAEAAEA